MHIFLRVLVSLFVLGQSSLVQAIDPHPVRTELIASISVYETGRSFWAALVLKIDHGWHIYWKNPGDSGLPPTLELKEGTHFKYGALQFPIPMRIATPPLVTFGYERAVWLPFQVTPTGSEESLSLEGRATWLVCKEVCIPGEAPVEISLPRGPQQKFNSSKETIDHFIAAIPPMKPADLAMGERISGLFDAKYAVIEITPPLKIQLMDILPLKQGWVETLSPPVIKTNDSKTVAFFRRTPQAIEQKKIQEKLLFVVNEANSSFETTIELISKDNVAVDNDVITLLNGNTTSSQEKQPTFWAALVLAFLGGIILNLMPCVFPVLSIKILHWTSHKTAPFSVRLRFGLFYGLGILVSFWFLLGVLFTLKAGGEKIGWGFQLQSPLFLTCLMFVTLILGLNLLGVFEVGERLSRLGGRLDRGEGFLGAFFSGVLTTLVASPCTAPFMGSAVGFALAQSKIQGAVVFTSLAMGLAAPYIVLTLSPRLLAFLPRPGAWMESLKKILALPMFLTVLWLLWVSGHQSGINFMTAIAAFLLVTAFTALLVHHRPAIHKGITFALIVSAVLYTYVFSKHYVLSSTTVSSPNWISFDRNKREEALKKGQTVFIDYTAAWCITCQVNKKLVLETETIQKVFNEYNVLLMRADWTQRDPIITDELQKLNRSGVPVYALYTKKTGSAPTLLPELLTHQIVIDTLKDNH